MTIEAIEGTTPTTQCIDCIQKHLDEAWIAMHEFAYSRENRRFIRGSLRAVVLHAATQWKDIAEKARQCALLVQMGKTTEAKKLMEQLCEMADDAFDAMHPEVVERIKNSH